MTTALALVRSSRWTTTMNNTELVEQMKAASILGMTQSEAAEYLCVDPSRIFKMKTKHNIEFGVRKHGRQQSSSTGHLEASTASQRNNAKAISDARKAEFAAEFRRAEGTSGNAGYKVPTGKAALENALLLAKSKRDRAEIKFGYEWYQFELRQREAGLRPPLPQRGKPQAYINEQSERVRQRRFVETERRRQAALTHIHSGREYTATQIALLTRESVPRANDLLGRMATDGLINRKRKIVENGVSQKDKRTWRWIYYKNEVTI